MEPERVRRVTLKEEERRAEMTAGPRIPFACGGEVGLVGVSVVVEQRGRRGMEGLEHGSEGKRSNGKRESSKSL